MIAPGSIWRKRCQVVDGPDAAFNEIVVLGPFENELRLRPREFGPVISATEASIRENFELIEQPPPAETEDTLLTQAGEWVKP